MVGRIPQITIIRNTKPIKKQIRADIKKALFNFFIFICYIPISISHFTTVATSPHTAFPSIQTNFIAMQITNKMVVMFAEQWLNPKFPHKFYRSHISLLLRRIAPPFNNYSFTYSPTMLCGIIDFHWHQNC